MDAAFRRMAREVRLPGFRPGKIPRKVLEARIGTEAARNDALQHALPEYYAAAIAEHEVDAIAPPEIDITSGQEDGPVLFDAVVEVRPDVVVGGYDSLRVVIDSPEATDADVDERIERLREQFATLEVVDRPAAEGDTATIDITGTHDDEALDGLTAEGYQYRVGSGTVVAELDETLTGAKVGDILDFTAEHPGDGEPVDFRVLVKEVQATVLPDLDDAFAAEASEFDTLDELRADLRERIGTVKLQQAKMALREKTADALGELVEEEPPEALVETEMQPRLQDLAMRLQAQGIDLERLHAGHRPGPRGVPRGPAHRRPPGRAGRPRPPGRGHRRGPRGRRRGARRRDRRGGRPGGPERQKVREQFEHNGQIPSVRSDLRTRKAMEWILERVEVVDADGGPIDRDASSTPRPPSDRRGRRHRPDDATTPEQAELTIGTRLQLPGPHRRRADEPRRAGLRPLLAAAQGPHHLPGHADRRHHRQPGVRPAAAPRVGEPRQGHQHLHQQPRWRHHRAVRDLRHDAVRQARHRHDLLRPGRLGGRGAAGRRHQGQAHGPAPRPGPAPPALGQRRRARPPTSRSRPARSCGCATAQGDPGRPHRPGRWRRSRRDTDRDFVLSAPRPRSTASSTR